MDRLITGGIFSLVLALLALPAHAQAGFDGGAIVISSGAAGGGYWNAGQRLQGVAASMELPVENLESSGSMENLERLVDPASPVNLAFAQADAMRHFFQQRREDEQLVDVLENIGQECVFVIAGRDSGIDRDRDLAANGADISLGISSPTSGIAVTFDYMTSLLPDLAGVAIAYGNTSAAMEGLDSDAGAVDAVMVVHRPKAHSPEVDLAIANPERFQFVELSDDRFTRELHNGRAVYRRMRLALPGYREPVQTICVRGLLLGHKQKLSAHQRNRLTDLVNYHWMRVYATQ
ncbi:MAG: hypothetical protein CME59_08665 [Halioglobus sp.]|nr:hypothetical protein [Halioglobus sp.]|tara:strand:- start:29 stop:901 length:873 start_codon:yes stop_codon:yes gene_type:complete